MTTAERLDRLHEWLQHASKGEAVTVVQLMKELGVLRRGPTPEVYADLPADGISMQFDLERLLIDGRARRDGSGWRYAAGRPRVEPVKEVQGSLFG